MAKITILFLIILTGVVFTVIPNQDYIPLKEITIDGVVYIQKENPNTTDYFPFSDVKLYRDTYIYFILEKLVVVFLAFLILSEEFRFRNQVGIFFALMVLDLVDYLLTYGSVYFSIGGFPVSMNMIKVCVFLVVFSVTLNKYLEKRFFES